MTKHRHSKIIGPKDTCISKCTLLKRTLILNWTYSLCFLNYYAVLILVSLVWIFHVVVCKCGLSTFLRLMTSNRQPKEHLGETSHSCEVGGI